MYTQRALNRATGAKVACIASMAFLIVTGVTQADTWTGSGVNDNWSTNGNWLDGSPPIPLDSVIFNAGDSGGINIVDPNFQDPLDPIKSITGLQYLGNGVHTTNVTSGNQLEVNGTASVGIGGGTNGGTATWTGEGSVSVNALNVSRNDVGTGNNVGLLDLITTNPMQAFETTIDSALTIGIQATRSGSGSADGTLILGSDSTLNVGAPTSRADLTIGRNDSAIAPSDAKGLLNALNGTANLRLNELNIGHSTRGQSATGALQWNQAGAIDATTIYLSRGVGAVGSIDTPAGGTLRLGSDTAPVGTLRIGWNGVNRAGVASGTLDLLNTTNPTFEAVISNELTLGANVTGISNNIGMADGTLVLGSNSTLKVGTPTSRANLTIGRNESHDADVTSDAKGLLNALNGTANLRLNELNIGHSTRGQSATGALQWNQAGAIDATTIYLSRGVGAVGSIDTPAGGTLRLGSDTAPVGTLRIGWNGVNRAGVASGTLDLLNTTNPTFEAVISNELTLGANVTGISNNIGMADGTLVLGSNSTLKVGTPTSRANLTIGRNESHDADVTSDAKGLLNALNGTANLRLNELNIGHSTRGQSATGALQWNQAGAIDATTIYLSRGVGAVGSIDTPAGGTLRLGSDTAPVGTLRIGWNGVNRAGVASGTLDLLNTTNPTFEAVISNELTLGANVTGISNNIGMADGTLVLGSNSTLKVGTPTSRANLTIGRNESHDADVTSDAKGLLNALNGTANLRLNELNIGHSTRGQSATGTFSMGTSDVVDVTTVNIGTGTNASGTVDLTGGLMTADTINLDEGAFNFTGGRLAVNTFNGTLDQQGGTLAPGVSPDTTLIAGVTNINGDYNLSAGTLEIELFGTNPGSEYDQVFVNGLVDLNGDEFTGGILDLKLGFAPSLGDSFTIVENDGTDLITTAFFGLEEGASLTEFFGGQAFIFKITYAGGTGNDIVVGAVPIPPAVWLFGSGLLGLVGVARRRAV